MEGERSWRGVRKIMNPGAKLDISIFSSLDTVGYLKELCAVQ